ncbi:MAG: hypothetical protein DRO88_05960 [Promethearchaeia archaeon]|nr:MAG: hypothetical protein DRO88_05960 [Candidatus Lokiarchaeia archaeon]
MGRRLYFLDFLRGLAIIGVVVNHAIVYGIMFNNENAMKYLPKSPLVIFAPFMIFATWAGLFAVINGIGISYNLYLRLENGIPLKKALKSPLIHSTSILIIHFIFQLIFTRGFKNIYGTEPWWSIGTGSIIQGSIQPLNLLVLYRSDALSMIAMSGYFSCLIMGIIWKDKTHFSNLKRTFRILTELAIIWLALSASLWQFLYYRLFLPALMKGGVFYIFALLLSLIAPHGHGIFPYGAYTIVGLLFGFAFARQESRQQIKRVAKLFAWGLIGMGALLIFFHFLTVPNISLDFFFNYIVIPPDLYIPNLGFMILAIIGLSGKFKDQSTEFDATTPPPIFRKTKFIRDMGKITLTLYCWENVWSSLMRVWFIRLFSSILAESDVLMENFGIQLLFLLTYCLSWLIIIWLWKMLKNTLSMEWIVYRLDKIFGKPTFENFFLPKTKIQNKNKN